MSAAALPASTPATGRDVAADIQRGTVRLLADHGFFGVSEFTLPNQRRADFAALGPGGELWIIEIKSCAADFLSDRKWQDYLAFCDRFFFAIDAQFPVARLPAETGLIIADGFGGAFVREAPLAPLAAARRKALTLRLARLAAARLSLIDRAGAAEMPWA